MAQAYADTAAAQDRNLRSEFRSEFNASTAGDMVDDDVSQYALVSDDNTTTLVNAFRVESLGCTDMADYRHVSDRLTPARVINGDGEHKADVYAIEVDGVTCTYDRARIDRIMSFVGVDRQGARLSAWKAAPSDVALLRVLIPGTSWAVVLAPFMTADGDDVERTDTVK